MPRMDRYAPDPDEKSPLNWVWTALLIGGVGVIAGGAGFVLPYLFSGGSISGYVAALRAPAPEAPTKLRAKAAGRAAFVPFGEVVVNLAEERMTRHLQVRITLLVRGGDAELVEQSLESNRALLMNWLISYLSDKSLNEVRGAAGVNQARREIHDQFNRLLFADGSAKVKDVLFEEFTVR